MSDEELRTAHTTQEKFEFYLISLCFTILALSVQTASFGNTVAGDCMELSAWFLLLISGVSGLWRMEWNPIWRLNVARLESTKDKANEIRKLRTQGKSEVYVLETNKTLNLEERLENLESAIGEMIAESESLDKVSMRKYKVHRICFIFGILSLVSSRSVGPILQLVSI